MIASWKFVLPRALEAPVGRAALLCALALGVFCAALALLTRPSAPLLSAGTGMYAAEDSLRWTGSQADFPLAPHSGPTVVDLALQFSSWPGRDTAQVWLESDAGALGEYRVTPQRQHLTILLPPGASFLRLRSTLGQPPGDWRWLGVQVLSVAARPSGWPTRAIGLALLCALASLPLASVGAWAARRGYGLLVPLTLLALALRLVWLGDAPPLMHRDETVSLVDAWHLAHTAHDHLGHFLPIAAFEGFGDWISPLLTYLLLPWVALFGPQPLVARAVVAVFGALAVPALYGLGREFRLPGAAWGAALVAALSPWQIFLSRVAIPPALVPTMVALCLWAGLRLIIYGRRRDAFWLAVAAGPALYAYPTLKMAVPLLVLAAVALAAARHGPRALLGWFAPAALLALLWLPFALSTLFNPSSSARLQLVALHANSPGEWLALWWGNYRVYFQPDTYYGSGGLRKIVQGVQRHGLALAAEGVAVIGLLGLLLPAPEPRPAPAVPRHVWLFVLLALLIAPLPASLTNGNPHAFRASALTPVYAALVGLGLAGWWRALGRLPAPAPLWARVIGAATLCIVLAGQAGAWFGALRTEHRAEAESTWFYADNELAAMQGVIALAPNYEQVWFDTRTIGRPYIFLLAADPMPTAEAAAAIRVQRDPPQINNVTEIGRYHFGDFVHMGVPEALPAIVALPTSHGLPGYLAQEWQHDGRRWLVVRGMPTALAAPPDDSTP